MGEQNLSAACFLPLDSSTGIADYQRSNFLVADEIKITLDRMLQATGCHGKLDCPGRFSKIFTVKCMQKSGSK